VRKLLGRLLLLGALIGGVVAARGYLKRGMPGEEVVQIVFDDGSTRVLASNSAQGQDFTDIASKIVEIGV
jgi:hypothetical protein